VFLKGDNFATRYRRARFLDQGLRPRHVVVIGAAKLGEALVQQSPRRLLNGGEVARSDKGVKARFLIGRKGDYHVSLYHITSPPGTPTRADLRGRSRESGERKTALLGNGSDVARAVQDAHDDNLVVSEDVIDPVIALKYDAQAGRKLLAGRPQHGECDQARTRCIDLVEQPRCCGFGLIGDVGPNLRKIGFRRFGYAEGSGSLIVSSAAQ
jgi:hypothetical protein